VRQILRESGIRPSQGSSEACSDFFKWLEIASFVVKENTRLRTDADGCQACVYEFVVFTVCLRHQVESGGQSLMYCKVIFGLSTYKP
jgi:hypothetical protein